MPHQESDLDEIILNVSLTVILPVDKCIKTTTPIIITVDTIIIITSLNFVAVQLNMFKIYVKSVYVCVSLIVAHTVKHNKTFCGWKLINSFW